MADLNWESAVVIVTLVVGLIVMAGDWVGPDLVFAGMVAFLTACRIITTNQATAGFSSSGLLTVVALYVVAEGIGQTGGMEKCLNLFMGKTKSPFWAQVRMFIPVVVASAFLNNTPIVALLIPILIGWARRSGISPKKILIPLSYAAVFGGTLTLIGTSTNLVISSLQEKRYAKTRPKDATFNFFAITPFGIPYAIFGMIYTLVASVWLLPGEDTKKHSDLLFVARVLPGTALPGNTIRGAGLKGLERLFLVAIERNGQVMHAVGPDFLLQAGDLLYLCGEFKQAQLYAAMLGFQLLDSDAAPAGAPEAGAYAGDAKAIEGGAPLAEEASRLYQATVRKGSDVVGRSIRDIGFRGRFGGAVLAVKRFAARQPGRLGDIVLREDDVLVIMAANKEAVEAAEFKRVFKDIEPLDATLEKEFLTAMRVTPRYAGINKTVHAAGLRGIEGLYLVGIDRADGEQLRVVDPDTIIREGDLLWFCGGVNNVYFVHKTTGLEHAQAAQINKLKADILYRQLTQVCIASDSPLIHQSVREAHFRNKYDAAVVAIHRQGERIQTDVRDVRLAAGDVLLLDTGANFSYRHKDSRAFALIADVPATSPLKTTRMWLALALGAAMITTQIVGGALDSELINLFTAAVLTGGLMLLTRCFNAEQARQSIDWRVYVTIAFAFAMSTALEVTQVAQAIADVFIDLSESIGGTTAAFVSIYIATAVLSEIVSNNAAAALMYPIAARLGDALGLVPTRMSIVVMLGASAGFTLPYSYQTNLMVFAAGDYRFLEFAKFGLPCQLWQVLAVLFIFALDDHIGVAIGLSFAFLATVLAVPLTWHLLPAPLKLRLTPKFLQSKVTAAQQPLLTGEPVKPAKG